MDNQPKQQPTSGPIGSDVMTSDGESLLELSQQRRLLVVFLRHGGCPFCRQVLSQLQNERTAIESRQLRIVLVHMMSDDEAKALFAEYKLDDVPRISDPDQRLYQAFEVPRGNINSVMGPEIWWKGFCSTVLSGNRVGKPRGDIFQLPGLFVVSNGQIEKAHRAKNSADLPQPIDFVGS